MAGRAKWAVAATVLLTAAVAAAAAPTARADGAHTGNGHAEDCVVRAPFGPGAFAAEGRRGPGFFRRPDVKNMAASTLPVSLGRGNTALVAATIDAYVHVIREDLTVGGGNIPGSWITTQMAVLNDAFGGGLNGGFNTPFRFVLKGTTRTTNADWYSMDLGTAEEAAAKAALRTGTYDDLNIYVVGSPFYLGWATFPEAFQTPTILRDDGVVLLNQSMPGGDLDPYNLGDTAPHEVGHWLGLLHTFQGGCGIRGDAVADTPAEASPAFGCPAGRNTCAAAGSDPIANYMDYTDDACMNAFTKGQSDRMASMWSRYRAGK